ncbi:hypothetical protein [Methylobacter sp. BBA5.1]|nr:hypothetical protein [Methylobacter sp. BBA5.1]
MTMVDYFQLQNLASLIRYRSVLGDQDKILPVQHMLTTLFLHKTHHRGQVTA